MEAPNPQSGRQAATEDAVNSFAAEVTMSAQFAAFGIADPHHSYAISQPAKLFVGGVSGTTTKRIFDEYFSQFGYMIDSVVMFDKETRNSRGFGFVTYLDKADADMVMDIQAQEVAKAIEALKRSHPGEKIDESTIKAGHVIDDKVVEIKRAEPRQVSSPNGKWKGHNNHYNQLQHQYHARRNGANRGRRNYPKSMPYRQMQQLPYHGYPNHYLHQNQMYMQHYPHHMYGQQNTQYYNAAGEPVASPPNPYYPAHPHQQHVFPNDGQAYYGIDGNVYYNPQTMPPPPPNAEGDGAEEEEEEEEEKEEEEGEKEGSVKYKKSSAQSPGSSPPRGPSSSGPLDHDDQDIPQSGVKAANDANPKQKEPRKKMAYSQVAARPPQAQGSNGANKKNIQVR